MDVNAKKDMSLKWEAVRRLLESNLLVSGDSTLQAVEAALLEREKEALQAKKRGYGKKSGMTYRLHTKDNRPA